LAVEGVYFGFKGNRRGEYYLSGNDFKGSKVNGWGLNADLEVSNNIKKIIILISRIITETRIRHKKMGKRLNHQFIKIIMQTYHTRHRQLREFTGKLS